MNLYVAAVYTNHCRKGQRTFDQMNEREQGLVQDLPNILESWHYVGKQKFVDEMRQDGGKIFLDSGAFSAYTLGVKLSVAEYCNYIERNKDIIRVENNDIMASVLDGIGDPLQTWRNQLEMEARGVRPLPCFHAGEDERYLEHYVKNYEYITLGGMVGASSKQLMIWLDRIWDRYLTDGSGNARIKVHGFGITAIPIMERYPWFSCDSSSWVQTASFGGIMTAKHGPINISDKSPSRHDANQHITTLPPLIRDYLMQLIEEQGFTYERLSTIYQSRFAYNLWQFKELGDRMAAEAAANKKFTTRVQELF